jgi:hypothetical protein
MVRSIHMGDISDGMCVKCGREVEDGGGGVCDICRAVPALSVAKVRLVLLAEGIDVADPAIESAQYDLIVRRPDGVWCAVQVKTAYGGVVNTCRTDSKGRRAYSKNYVDYFAIVDDANVYMIPISGVNNGGRMNMEDIRNDPRFGWEEPGGRTFWRKPSVRDTDSI